MIEMNLDLKYYKSILYGIKKYEMRVYDLKRQQIKLLDELKFIERGTNNSFKVIITELSWYKTFTQALKETNIKDILPDVDTFEEAVKTYESFPHKEGTYKEGSEKFGVLRIKFKLNFN